MEKDIIKLVKKLRLYFDTSIINFVFADDAPAEKIATLSLFDQFDRCTAPH